MNDYRSATASLGFAAPSHTPGPWAVDYIGEKRHHDWSPEPTVAHVGDYRVVQKDARRYGGIAPCETDARLIAAAPDLLEALKHVLTAHGEQLHDAFDQAQKAIARAEGQANASERS